MEPRDLDTFPNFTYIGELAKNACSDWVTPMTHDKLYALAEQARGMAYLALLPLYGGGAAVRRRHGLHRLQHRKRGILADSLRRARRHFRAVSEGRRSFKAIAVAGGPAASSKADGDCFPSGGCRQVLAEFCPPTLEVVNILA